MKFELDHDEAQLQDSLRRLLAGEASFAQRRQAVATEAGWSPALWRSLGALGVTALVLPEEAGGFGQRPVAWLPVLQALGHALAVQPFLPTVVLAATAIARAGTPAQRAALLPLAAEGSGVLGFAHEERAARHAPLWVETAAVRDGEGWRLHGAKQNVLFGADASTLVASARTSGEPGDPGGVSLFVVAAGQPKVRRTPTRLVDDTPAADIVFDGAAAVPLGTGVAPLFAALDAGVAATCAEALGIAERAFALTVEYVQARQQFGRAIGTNQAVRHRVAEMHVALEMVRSAALAGLLALENGDAVERARELSRARMLVSRHATFVAQQAIQLHGGIGMTVEYEVGHALRRLTVLEHLFGDGPTHAARLGSALAQQE